MSADRNALTGVRQLAYSWMEDLDRAEQAPERGFIEDKDMEKIRCYADAGAQVLAVIGDAS